jgi:hypothetical protein
MMKRKRLLVGSEKSNTKERLRGRTEQSRELLKNYNRKRETKKGEKELKKRYLNSVFVFYLEGLF